MGRDAIERSHEMALTWWTIALLIADSHSVVAMRTLGMSGAWAVPKGENGAMIAEKVPAFTEAILSGTYKALSGHGPDQVLQATIEPLCLKASANRQRLARCGPTLFGVGAPQLV